jgi:lipopolysaccharide transport system ATP-binding protein
MIEQSKGVGITSLATHEDGAFPVQLPDGTWRSVLTFPDLPLHSGDYVISAFLFDETGLAVYDEWFQFMHFRFHFSQAFAWFGALAAPLGLILPIACFQRLTQDG